MPHPLLLALLILQASPDRGGAAYRNDTVGFEIVAPAGWVLLPDSVLHDRIAAMRRIGARASETNYVAAFTRTPGDWFAYPYVLVQVNELAPGDTTPTPEDLTADLSFFGNAARYDSSQHAVLISGPPRQVSPGVSIRGYSGIRLSRRGLVSVLAYGMEGDSLNTAAIRDRFLATLKVDVPPNRP